MTHSCEQKKRKRFGRMMWLGLLFASLAFMGPVSCLDFGVENEAFICRSESECAEGYTCLRGPGGHCICKPFGSSADPGWADPNCLNVQTQ